MVLNMQRTDNNNRAPLNKQEGTERGLALRETCPLNVHAGWEAPLNRPDPVELIRCQETTRVQDLLPIRHERMSVSAFTFYRGAALIMAQDLSTTPITGIRVQACGDAHISNFGMFSSPERRTVFDINDFDETLPGPFEWDIKRLAASVEICGQDNGFSKKERKDAVLSCVRSYRESMMQFAEMGNLDVWYAHADVEKYLSQVINELDKKTAKAANKTLTKTKNKNSAKAITKLTEIVDGRLRIISQPPLIMPLRDLAAESGSKHVDEKTIKRLMDVILREYRSTLSSDKRRLMQEYTPCDIARKVVGVGSVGTRAWIVVLRGADDNDTLVLQIKEAQESVLESFVGKSRHLNHGHRVVSGQRAMQTASDILLGWCRVPDENKKLKDYYVRQLWDGKGSIDLSLLNPEQLTKLAKICGWTLAHAHARTGDRFAMAAYMGETDEFDKAIAKFARAYAKQNEADYQRFMQALEAGEL